MRLSSLTGLRRSTAAALTVCGLASVAAVAAPASAFATTGTPVSAHQAHAAHLAHLHHLHVLHIARLNTQARAAANAASRSVTRAPLAPVTDTSPSAVRALARTMVPADQWASFDAVISHESSWNLHATNPSSGAYGLGQALPGSKMASVASDWRTNPVTQLTWTLKYMNDRYGSPNAAWAFWQTHHWY